SAARRSKSQTSTLVALSAVSSTSRVVILPMAPAPPSTATFIVSQSHYHLMQDAHCFPYVFIFDVERHKQANHITLKSCRQHQNSFLCASKHNPFGSFLVWLTPVLYNF